MTSDIGGPSPVPADFDFIVKRLTLDVREADRHLLRAHWPQSTLNELSERVDHTRSTLWAPRWKCCAILKPSTAT